MPKLTKKVVEGAESRDRDYVIWDDDVPGFGVRIFASGKRSYVIQYRAKGRARRLTLGPHGVLTAQDARKRALDHFSDVRAGADPSQTRRDEIHSPRMIDLWDRYLERHAKVKKKPSSVGTDVGMWNLHLEPKLGRVRVADVNRTEVDALHYRLRNTPIIANRVLALLSKMFNLAERWEWRPDGSNPCRHVERYPERPRERFLSEVELAKLGDALRAAELEHAEMPSAIAVLRFIILTGCRRGEALGLRWEHLDLERGFARLPDSKTGAKVLVLNAPTRQLLEDLKHDSEWVFPGREKCDPLSTGLTRIWYRIRARAEIGDEVRIHDLRHSYASVGAAGGVSLTVLGKLLGHTQAVTTQRYAHLSDDPVRQASERIGSRISAVMDGASSADLGRLSDSSGS
jgi:integrase